MAGRLSAVGAIAVAGLAAAGSGCTYAPHPGDGQLLCSAKLECPDGYECLPPNSQSTPGTSSTCWAKTSGTTPGLGGTAFTSKLPLYVGTWAFSTSNILETKCDDGTSSQTILGVTSMVLAVGTATVSDIDASYPCATCTLGLRLDASGAHLFDSNPNFEDTTSDPMRFLTIRRFDLATADGVTAKHTAVYDLEKDYATATPPTVLCVQWVNTTLTKL